jgi:putative phosphoribosyl transferase
MNREGEATGSEHQVHVVVRASPAGRRYPPTVGSGGIVLFAHGSGSSRPSPRNRFVAGVLQDGGCCRC